MEYQKGGRPSINEGLEDEIVVLLVFSKGKGEEDASERAERLPSIPFSEPLDARVNFMYLNSKSLGSTRIGNLLDQDDMNHLGTNPQLLPIAFILGWFDKGTDALTSHAEIEQENQTINFSGTAAQKLAQKKAITRLRITH